MSGRSPSRRFKNVLGAKHRPSLSPVPEDMADSRADEADALLSLRSRQPGRNAFAEDADRHNRYMLGTNAFVQQEFSRREGTPPTMVHPALRHNFNLLDTSQPLPKLDQEEVKRHMAQQPRDSDMTTMSRFLAVSMEVPSPDLNLGTTPDTTPQPTQRAFIEDHREQQAHEQSGRDTERVPVYKHTPKAAAEEFATPQVVATKKLDDTPAQQTPATRSPKKSFLSRFGWSNRSKTATPQTLPDAVPETPDSTHMSVKARAVLVDAPPKRGLIRSPSKPKGLFSRRTSDATEVIAPTTRSVPPRAATSLGHRTPQNITWHLPRSNSKKKLSASQKSQDEQTGRNTQTNTTLGRSKSLKNADGVKPPTPPAKDTPPEEQARRKLAQQSKLNNCFNDDTPTKQPSASTTPVTPSISITPTSRQASFGHRGQGTLVTAPSMYSMRASVVPDAMDKSAFDDAKSRMNGLGIEGFNMPDECNQGQSSVEYTPSIYSPDTFRNSVLRFPERAGERIEKKLKLQTSMDALRVPAHIAQDSQSTTGTIPMVYPELAKDPSIASFMEYDSSLLSPPQGAISSPPQPGEFDHAWEQVSKMVKDDLTVESPVSPGSEASTEGLFAIPLMRTPQQPARSPMSNHPSAMPSPLRKTDGEAYLPASTFQPPIAKSKKESKAPAKLRLQKVDEEKKISDGLPTPDDLPWTPSGRPKPKPSIFDNKPELVRPKDLVVRQSPPMGGKLWTSKDSPHVDPQKSPRARSPSPRSSSLPKSHSQDLDQLQQLSDTVLALARQRETDIEQMNDSVRAENARLHQRIASLEIRNAEPKPEICYGDENNERRASAEKKRRTSAEKKRVPSAEKKRQPSAEKKRTTSTSPPKKRISTSHAHQFYESSKDSQSNSPVESIATTEKSTIILTPNLPRNMSLPRPGTPASGTLHRSSSPAPTTPAPPPAGADQLYALVLQQQQMMMSMMEEIRDLKRQGNGNDEN